ncbi:MAG: VCBS repeat-containing protein [Akkermansiaceae bacterium]|nr:VCBS repeat-containing protein [Akkermansiaceae bacterium]NNM28705.1 VCBS repeat-containing protein [Akkermansiaceae bacterium]
MKNSSIRLIPLLCTVGLLSVIWTYAQQGKKRKGPPRLRFTVKKLHLDNNEGCAVGDINKDGVPDITAGEFWYKGPEFAPHPVRKLLPFGKDYMQSNGEHLLDVNADGWLDVVSGSFMQPKLSWYENPGSGGDWSQPWKAHELVDTGHVKNENTRMRDLDGDGIGEIIIDSWDENNPLMAWKITPGPQPSAKKILIGEAGSGISNGHGIGFGDVNGDGREDIIFKNGWYERPAEGAMDKPWVHHADWSWDHAGSPMLVVDLNNDGRNDVIWGDGHNYGLYWMQQREPASDGSTNWRMHTIDKKFSQAHTMAWADMDGNGTKELITGKRVRAHSGRDPGGTEDPVVIIYTWNPKALAFSKNEIHRGEAGIGLQIRIADMNADGRPDIVVPGKSGTHVLFNEGPK